MIDKEIESGLDREMLLIARLLQELYPVGCPDAIIPPENSFCDIRKIYKKSVNRLTLRYLMAFIIKLIYNKGD